MCEKKQKEQAQEEAKNEAFASYPRGKLASRRFALLQGFFFPLTVSTNLSHGSDFFWEEVWGSRFEMTFGYIEKYRICSQHCQKSIRYTYAW